MGMFDKPKYLTGDEGFVQPGEEFFIHAAALDGVVNVNGNPREQAKLRVSKDGNTTEIVYTSGAGIVGQIKRMDANDRNAMPIKVRIDELPSGKGNPTRVLTPADQPAPTVASNGDDF